MNRDKKRQLLRFSTILAIGVSGAAIFLTTAEKWQLNRNYSEKAINSTVAALKDAIKQEEQRVWQEIEQKLGISRTRIDKMVQESLKDLYNIQFSPQYKDLPLANHRIQKLVKSVLKPLGADLNGIKIVQRKQNYPACAIGTLLIFDEKTFSHYSESAQKFIIAHEYQHIRHIDGLMIGCIKELANITEDVFTFSRKYPTHPLCQYLRFKEWRADTEALIANIDLLNNYKEFCEITQDNRFTTHPSHEDRLKVAHLLNNHLEKIST